MDKLEDRILQERAQRFLSSLKKAFPTIVGVVSVHDGPNRAQRRALKFKHGGKSNGKPTKRKH